MNPQVAQARQLQWSSPSPLICVLEEAVENMDDASNFSPVETCSPLAHVLQVKNSTMIPSAIPTFTPVASIVFTWNLFCLARFSKVTVVQTCVKAMITIGHEWDSAEWINKNISCFSFIWAQMPDISWRLMTDDLLQALQAERARKKEEKFWPTAPANVISLKSSGNVWHLSYVTWKGYFWPFYLSFGQAEKVVLFVKRQMEKKVIRWLGKEQ